MGSTTQKCPACGAQRWVRGDLRAQLHHDFLVNGGFGKAYETYVAACLGCGHIEHSLDEAGLRALRADMEARDRQFKADLGMDDVKGAKT